jgi:hypothetical protein
MSYDDYLKRRTLRIKKTLDFISKFPNGATAMDFEEYNLTPYGVERLMKLGQVVGTQVREPERGTRCYRWLWKIKKLKEGK